MNYTIFLYHTHRILVCSQGLIYWRRTVVRGMYNLGQVECVLKQAAQTLQIIAMNAEIIFQNIVFQFQKDHLCKERLRLKTQRSKQ